MVRCCEREITAEHRLNGAPDSDHPDAERLNREGMRLGQSGKLEAAVAALEQALRLDPRHWAAHNNLGIALARLRRFDQAAASFHRAIALRPAGAQAHNNLANALAEQRRHDEAIPHFQCALRLDPAYPDARLNLGKALLAAARFEEAADQFRQVVELDPGIAKAHRHLGLALAAQGKRDDAIPCLRQAIELDPDDPESHFHLACVLKAASRREEAIASLERALILRPAYFEVLNVLGTCLTYHGQPERAIDCFDKALALGGESAATRSSRGIALAACGRYDEAMAEYGRALELKPDYVEIHNNAGCALVGLHRYEEALARYALAIDLKPEYAEAHRNLGLMQLLRGDLEKGWPELEWRWKCPDFDERHFAQPAWDGGALDGKAILLHAEQGLGDTLQLIRYAPLVKEQGGRVVARIPKHLVALLSRCPDVDQIVTDDDFNDFDVHLPMMSLPKVFGTTLETIPNRVPYLFADEELIEYWRQELTGLRHLPVREEVLGLGASVLGASGCNLETENLATKTQKLRPKPLLIGIAWQGNPKYLGDRQRSIPLACFAPLAQVRGVRLINLQKGHGTDQLFGVADKFFVSEPVGDVDLAHGRFMDTAAIMKNLDLVITSDSAVAHLAGGLGVNVWVALPYAPDWRWLLDRNDSPWYPTMRLFRQETPGDWNGVFRRIRRALRRLAEDPDCKLQIANCKLQIDPEQPQTQYPRPKTQDLRPNSENPKLFNERGLRLASSGKPRQALVEFQRAVWLNPRAIDAHYNLGATLDRLGRFDQAVASFRRCLRLSPRWAQARANLGVSLANLGDCEQAEKELRHALRLAPKAVEIHYSLGNALASQAKWDEALRAFQRALALRADFAQAHYGAGNVLRQQEQYHEALAAYDRALDIRPDLAAAQRQRATTHLLLGDFEKGWTEYAREGTGDRAQGTENSKSKIENPKSLLLSAGGDLKETLLLLRYAELAKREGARVWVRCPKGHDEIVGRCRGVDLVLAGGGQAPATDSRAPLANLPAMLGAPAPEQAARVPFLDLDPSLVDRWRKDLGTLGGVKIAVAWHCDVRDGEVPAEWIESLAQMPQVGLVYLGGLGLGAWDLGGRGSNPITQDLRPKTKDLRRRSPG